MHLIADSGSSKTDWVVCKADKILQKLETKGFNPYYYTSDTLDKLLEQDLLPKLKHHEVSSIFFYGSGCSTETNQDIIYRSLRKGFKNAKIEINHDLLGAARSLFGKQAGIAAILGTGSNSAVYNGKNITHNIPSVGYFFGDEGSGSNLGKRLIASYLKNEMPADIKKIFDSEYNYSFEYILKQIYNTDSPVKFFASLTPFILDHIKTDFLHELVYSSFHDFFEQNICKYEHYEEMPIKFVGSIAFIFADILNEAAHDLGIKISAIRKAPMEGLIEYHS